MAITAIPDSPSSFEFNPAAPEFVPTQAPPEELELPPASVDPSVDISADLGLPELHMPFPLLPPDILAAVAAGGWPGLGSASGLGPHEVAASPNSRLMLVPRGSIDSAALSGLNGSKKCIQTGRRKERKNSGVISGSAKSSPAVGPEASPLLGPISPLLSASCDPSVGGRHSRRGSAGSEKVGKRNAGGGGTAADGPAQVATLVIKNLALDLEEADIAKQLAEAGAAAAEVELHRDVAGAFRGTAFARYSSPEEAREAIEKLGSCPELGGRKARVELQKSRALLGRRSLEAELPQEDLGAVRDEIERFLSDAQQDEVGLPSSFTADQRKYAHALAERHGLLHATRQSENGAEKFVFLSKARPEPPPGSRRKAYSAIVGAVGSPPGIPLSFVDGVGQRSATRRSTAPGESPQAAPGLPPCQDTPTLRSAPGLEMVSIGDGVPNLDLGIAHEDDPTQLG